MNFIRQLLIHKKNVAHLYFLRPSFLRAYYLMTLLVFSAYPGFVFILLDIHLIRFHAVSLVVYKRESITIEKRYSLILFQVA